MLTQQLMPLFNKIRTMYDVILAFSYLQEFCERYNGDVDFIIELLESGVLYANKEGIFANPDNAVIHNNRVLGTA